MNGAMTPTQELAMAVHEDERPLKEKCDYADKYKALRPPICGCRVCMDKWMKGGNKP